MTRMTFDENIPPVSVVPPPKPCGYMLYVRPRPPSETIGSGLLHRAKRSKQAESAITTIGQVVAMGSLAKKVKVGDLDPAKDPVNQSITVGTWVHYRQLAGQRLRIRRNHDEMDAEGDEYIIGLGDEDILGVFDDEAHASRYYDWLD